MKLKSVDMLLPGYSRYSSEPYTRPKTVRHHGSMVAMRNRVLHQRPDLERHCKTERWQTQSLCWHILSCKLSPQSHSCRKNGRKIERLQRIDGLRGETPDEFDAE